MGYPKKEALEVAIDMIRNYGKNLEVQIILFDKEICKIAQKNFKDYWK